MADITYKINNKGSDYYLASSAYYVCDTAASAVEKVAYLQNSSSNTFNGGTLPMGITIYVKFKYSNTASNPTLNVNGSGAKAITIYGITPVGNSVKTSWRAGAIVAFTFDGLRWVMNTNLDNDNDTDTKNTAGATQQAGTLHIIGAPSRGVNPQTYSSSNITMHNGCLNTPNLNVENELLFESGGVITARDGAMSFGSPNGVINVVGSLATSSVNINGEEAATKKWVVDWLDNNYGEAVKLEVWLEQVVAGEEPVNYFKDIVNASTSRTFDKVIPYAVNDANANYLCFSSNIDDVNFSYTSTNNGASLSPYYYDFYCRRLALSYTQGTLDTQVITVVLTAGQIEYTLYLKFNSPYYAN